MAWNDTQRLTIEGEDKHTGYLFQVETVFLALVGFTALLVNILQFRTIFYNRKLRLNVTKDFLVAVLTILNILAAVGPTIAYVVARNGAWKGQALKAKTSNDSCVAFFVTFVWLKLCVLFVTAAFVYTSYVQYINSNSSSDVSRFNTLSSQKSFASQTLATCSCSTRRPTQGQIAKSTRRRNAISLTLIIVVFGIVFISLIISSLPFIGLGPQLNRDHHDPTAGNDTAGRAVEKYVCSLRTLVRPKAEKEYTYLFAIIMSSTASFLLQAFCFFACVFHYCQSKQLLRQPSRASPQTKTTNGRRAGEVNEGTSVGDGPVVNDREAVTVSLAIGIMSFVTWTPLMVALCLAAAGTMVSERLVTIFLLMSFTNLVVDPLIYYGLSRDCRNARGNFITTAWSKIKNAKHGKNANIVSISEPPS